MNRPVSAVTGINEHINFQGRLFNAQGATVPDGNYNIQFKIYQDGAGTTAGNPGGSLEWTEEWLNDDGNGVQIKNGYMSVELGSVNPFGSSIDWNQDTLWLSMNIGDTNTSCTPFSSCGGDGEMVPMKRLSSSVYALNAGKLGGLTSAQFLQLAQGVQTDASTNTTSIYLNKTGGGNFLQLQSSGTDVFTLSNSGDIQFGNNADHTISVGTSAASTAGRTLTVSAGTGGSGTGSAGGDLVLQGGDAGGTNGNGGNVTLNAGAKTGSGTDGTISIGTSNTSAITLGADVTLSNGKSLTISGGNTASRPASPTEGMVYYDTTTKQLLTYANGKWQGDRSTSTKIVAASNSSQAMKDAADYVADGTADESEINSALTAAAGGQVYLAEGTYVAAATISIPNNTILAGAGRGTVIELGNLDSTENLIENSDTTTGTGVVIRDLKLDGRSDLNTAGTQYGIYLNGMGSGSGSSAIGGATISNISATRFRNDAVYLTASSNNKVTSSTFRANTGAGLSLNSSSSYNVINDSQSQGNSAEGFLISGSNHNTFSGNNSQSNSTYGFNFQSGSARNTVSGNSISENPSAGIRMSGETRSTVVGNTIRGGGSNVYGIYLLSSAGNNAISSNTIYDTGGAGATNGIYLDVASYNNLTNNVIGDSSCTTTCYAININNASATGNYVASNNIDSGASINNIGTNTLTGGQMNGSGAYNIQASGGINLQNNTSVTGSLTASTSVLAPTIDTASAGTLSIGTTNATAITLAKNTTVTANLTVSNAGNVAFQRGSDFSTTGSSDDVDFGTGVLFRLTGASTQTITGIANGVDGRVITLVNAASQAANINNEAAGSSASNRIITGTGSNISLPAGSSVSLVYDSGASRWRIIGAAGTSDSYIQLQASTPGTAQTGNFNISGTGIAATLQGNTSVLTPLLDTVSAGTLNIGTTNATSISLNQDVTIAANKNITYGAGTGSFDQSASSGTFKTGTGAVSLNGDTTVASGKNFTVTSGTTSITGTTSINTSGSSNTSIGAGSTGTVTIGNSSTGAVGVVSGAALTLTGGAASTLSTTTGTLTLQGGSGVNIVTPNAATSSAITIQTGNSTSGTAASVGIDTGTSTSGTSAVNIGTVNAGSVVIGKSSTTTTIQGGLTSGVSAGTGTFTNNGSTKNTSLALGDLAAGSIGTAADTVDKYTSFTISPTASGRTYTIPAPTDGGVGRIVYISNINATNTFIIGSTTFNTHSTATLVYDGTGWNFAGMDGGSNNYIQNQVASAQSAGFNISGTGTAATLQAATFDTASAVALNIGTTNATQINLNKNVSVAANQNLTFAAGTGSFDQSASTGTFKTGTGAVSLNGDTTVASGKNLTVTSGTTSLTGTTNINTTGGAATSIGNTSGGAVTIAANASSSFTTNTGTLSLQAASGIQLQSNTAVTGTLSATTSLQAPLLDTASAVALNIGTTNATSINLNKDTNLVGNLTFDSGANRTLSIGTSAASTAGRQLTIAAGTGGSGTGSAGGDLQLQGGAAGGTNANGGNIYLDAGAKAGSGVDGSIYLGSTRATTIQIGNTALASGTQTINIGTNNTSGGTTNITIGTGSTATGGTTALQAKSSITLTTNGTTRATFDNTNSVYFGNGVTAAAPNAFTISGTGSSTSGTAGGSLTIQGGNATVGNANGGNVTLTGGSGFGTGVKGLVVIDTPTVATASSQDCAGADCTITQANVNNNGAVIVSFSSTGLEAAIPDPTIATAGRIVYVTAANGSSDFTLCLNDVAAGGTYDGTCNTTTGNSIAMRANTTATLVWNGSDWTAAGASSSTDLQAAYNNTLTSAGAAELIVSSSSNANGLTIRDSSTSPVNGTLLEVQNSAAATLFSVNGTVTEYASNAGAESTFSASNWVALGASTVTRNTTTSNVASGQGSAQVATTSAASDGVKNVLSTALTASQHYNLSFSAKLSSGTFTDLAAYYSIDGSANSVTCTTGQAIKTKVWTKVTCAFTAPTSGITSNNSINIRQVGSGTARTFYVDNLSVTIAADYNYATDGTVNDNTNFTTNWTAVGTSTVSRNTSDGQEASDSAQAAAGTTAGNGVKNKLSINPLASTLYRVSVYAKLSSGSAFTDFTIRYTPDNGTNFVNCVDYSTQTVTTTDWTQITCYIDTAGTTVTNPYVHFVQTAAAGVSRTFLVDDFSMTLSSAATPNVQIGGGANGGPVTLFTLDRGASAPIAENNDALLGSMYYDTTLGKLQCYEADGWGACGSSPDNVITISPEYTNAVLHGTGIGTMTSDLCSDTLNINDGSSGQSTICGTNETYNFYKWTSPQSTAQTYSIYVTYQLPSTFKEFSSGSTSLMGRTDSANSTVNYQVYRSNTSGLTACGSTVSVSTGSQSSWQTGDATGSADPSTCSFAASESIVFKINVTASSNANAYVGNLNFTFSNR
ncbi:MAG TPA: carbohydrate binding domain-containing protein [Candidatus Saccharibacteria bacterium]|nr:carbohydrate binding domain-containing protein [Candidatus Saccharibacteria bacterium]